MVEHFFNNHDVEVYDNGNGVRISFLFQGSRRVLNETETFRLFQSLSYGLSQGKVFGCKQPPNKANSIDAQSLASDESSGALEDQV